MPDNQREGALEQFLEDLVDDNDPLLPIAARSTSEAAESGAEFPEVDHRKAVLHSWLAWQKAPGLPYGAAIKAQFFRDNSPAALAQALGCGKGGFLRPRFEMTQQLFDVARRGVEQSALDDLVGRRTATAQ